MLALGSTFALLTLVSSGVSMSGSNETRIAKFVRSEVTTSKPAGEIVRFELRQLPVGSKRGQHVFTAECTSERSAEWIETAAAEINASAEADADGISNGVQRYVVQAFRSGNPDKVTARIAFVVEAEDRDEGSIESEPANAAGLTAQLMRHLEAVHRTNLKAQGVMMQSMAKMVESVSDENEKLRSARMDTIETIEDMMTQKTERELAIAKSEGHMRLLAEVAGNMKVLVPAIAGRLTGKPVTAETPDSNPQVLLVKRFYESLLPEQKEKISNFMVEHLGLTPVGFMDAFADPRKFLGTLTEEHKTKIGQLVGELNFSPAQQIAVGEIFSSLT